MTKVVHPVDAGRLRHEVKAKYREVAEDPTADFHFHTGRAHARRLGYPLSPLDQLRHCCICKGAGLGAVRL
jgi:arsenite methyltransferase